MDWRIRTVASLVNDVPATPRGAPAHKAGALVVQATPGIDSRGRYIGFATPSAVALALDLAIKASGCARELQAQLDESEVVTPFGSGELVTHDSIPALYDCFQQCMMALTCAFQALEAFSNETISNRVMGTFPLERRSTINHVSAVELERQASTDEKLGTILPKLLGVHTPKGSRLWHDFVSLKRARDATIHLRSHDTNPKVAHPGDLDEVTLLHSFLDADVADWVRAAVSMLGYFAAAESPRWLGPAKKALGMRGGPYAPNQRRQNQKPRGRR